MLRVLTLIVVLLAGPLLSQQAFGQPAEDTLRISWRDKVADLDPYHNSLRNGLVISQLVWDGLISRDPQTLVLRPLLAQSWKQVDDTTLEFELRPGVSFHNGDAFTADDVVYTVQSILTDPKLAVPSNYAWLAGAEKMTICMCASS